MPEQRPAAAAPSPLTAYHHAVAQAVFVPDAAQARAAELLEACHGALHQAALHPGIQGVYLWGPVGRGKTWLLDCFYRSLQVPARRQHFHHFMKWVHQRLFQLVGTANPLQALAAELAAELRVLCFDELFVSDIGDATLIGPLFAALLEQGLVIVATSNQPPQQLYADGYNRERLLPAIAAMQRHMQVVEVDGGQDHRLHPGQRQQRYFVHQAAQSEALAALFAQLSQGHTVSHAPLALGQRWLPVRGHSPAALWCDFAQLCDAPLAAVDFMALCDRFPVILLSQVPRLGGLQQEGRIARGTEDGVQQVAAGDRQLPQLAPHDDGVRRFIALVDECYDRRVPLYLEAAVALEDLYTEGYLAFAFRRTLSRLKEMQLERFGQR